MKNRPGGALRGLLASAVLAGLCGNASAILLDRGPDMVYDTVLNITWTRQAGDGGIQNWTSAKAWVDAFSIVDPTYGRVDNWRLPYASVSSGDGPLTSLPVICTGDGSASDELACRDNEFAYMYSYNIPGGPNKAGDQTAVGDQELFNIQFEYWSGTALSPNASYWKCSFLSGTCSPASRSGLDSVWAVREGDVAPIPEPEIYLMMLIGLGLVGFEARRRKP